MPDGNTRKGTSWTRNEMKYIGDYARRHGYRLMMCGYPNVKYLRADGEVVTIHISTVSSDSAQQMAEEKKERARAKQAEKRAEEQRGWGRRVV